MGAGCSMRAGEAKLQCKFRVAGQIASDSQLPRVIFTVL